MLTPALTPQIRCLCSSDSAVKVPPRSRRRRPFPLADPGQCQTLQPWQRSALKALSQTAGISSVPAPHGQTHTAAMTGYYTEHAQCDAQPEGRGHLSGFVHSYTL